MSAIGDRMKRYEAVSHYHLSPKLPVIVRIDGKAFHSLTRGMEKPFSRSLAEGMWAGAIAFCKEASGVQIAFHQSDEISFLLTDWSMEGTQPWFDYDLQKLVSVAASVVGVAFSCHMELYAAFDARAFSLPQDEVVNYFIWRQQDATRNSVSMLAQAHFSAKELYGKKGPEMQDMLMAKGINWNDVPTIFKRGAAIRRESYQVEARTLGVQLDGMATRHRWVVDEETPIVTADREYIGQYVVPHSMVQRATSEKREGE